MRVPFVHVSAALLAALLWWPGVAPASAQATAAAPPAGAITADRLMDTVRELTSEPYAGRRVGTPGGIRARDWIRARYRTIGLEPVGDGFDQPFTFTPGKGGAQGGGGERVQGANLIGRCAGTDPSRPAIVVSAHYDHLGVREGRTYPGADDNASGVAVLLELAAICTANPFRHDLLFVAFDAEEGGLNGARAFMAAPPLPKARLALDVNLDMVARGDKGELYVAGLHHTPALRAILSPVAERAPIAVRFGHDLPGSGHDDWTDQSDHGVFHAAGIPFVYFGVEDHPDYHKPTDTADRIDPVFFAKAATVILDALRALDQHLP
ncbi:MAG: M28 family peptidase [Vicinamibacterales bacterium]